MRLLALLAAGLLVGALGAAPVPKEEGEKKLYFPTAVGTKWVMEVTTAAGRTSEVTDVVTKAAEKDGVFTVTVEAGGGRRQPETMVYEVTAARVRRVEHTVGATTTKPDQTLVDLGVKAGEGWTREFDLPGLTPQSKSIKAVYTFTQGKEEVVEVPAGKFTAIPVTEEGPSGKYTRWYAPGVGVVREERERMKQKSVTVLKAFTPGKEDKKAKDEEAIVGTWKAERVEVGDGKEVTAEQVAKLTYVYRAGGGMGILSDGKEVVKGEYTLDPAAAPRAIDQVIREGDKMRTEKGVYRLDGDTLTLCMPADYGADRPAELKAVAGKTVVITLKRVKGEPKKDK